MFKMKTVRKKMPARDVKELIDLPNYDDDQLVEITVVPAQEKKILSDEEIDAIMNNVRGCLKGLVDPSITVDDVRRERLENRYGIKFAD